MSDENAKYGVSRKADFELWTGATMKKGKDIPVLRDVEFSVIKKWEPEADGYDWLHGVALAWHKDKLYASFGLNKGGENSKGELAAGLVSGDGGRTWGEPFKIAVPREDNLGISHGVFLSHKGDLRAFMGAFHGVRGRVHARAYLLDEKSKEWIDRGIIVNDGFWPLQEPQKMADGNWIMSGIRCVDTYGHPDNCAAVAISKGDDFTRWKMIVIPLAAPVERMWAESNVFLDGPRVINIARYEQWNPHALAAASDDFGLSWTPSCHSNMPMTSSKPCTGTLSTGQHYLINTTTADCDTKRFPLTIAVTRPGEAVFSEVFVIRHAESPGGPGESNPQAALSYPYAVEHEGKLYAGYSNSGGRGGNRNSAELAIIPVSSLTMAPQ
ncbi:MAG: exo-alpha-sialidase [Victivallales bacterium]